MACLLDAKKAIMDSVFTNVIEGRYTYARISENSFRINSKKNNQKTKALSHTQASEIAKEVASRIYNTYQKQVIPSIDDYDIYSPVIVSLSVTDAYVSHIFNKFWPQQEMAFEYSPVQEMSVEERFQEWYKSNSNVPEDQARDYFMRCKM